MPTSRPSTMTTRFPKLASLWAIRAPDTPPPTIAISQLMFLVSFLWPATCLRFISHTGRPVRRSKLILSCLGDSLVSRSELGDHERAMPSTSVLMWFASSSLSCFSVASGLLFLASHVRGTHLFLGM